jgi:hypothetical protein
MGLDELKNFCTTKEIHTRLKGQPEYIGDIYI